MKSRFSLVDCTSVDEAYSLSHVGCFGSVLNVCVSRKAELISMTANREPSFGQPQRIEGLLTKSDWIRLKDALKEAEFWTLPKDHGLMGLDGWIWIIEGREGQRYHSSECWCPEDGAFHNLGNLMVGISGLDSPLEMP
jgi:hypothetical protein